MSTLLKLDNFKKNISFSENFQFWSSILFIFIFYAPYISHGITNMGFLFYEDNLALWFPQLINSYQFNNELIFKGIDFFTHGGASEYFLRPNLLNYHPLYLIFSFIFELENYLSFLNLFFLIFVLHSFLACYFTQKLCINFFKFDKHLALFSAVGFSFSIIFLLNIAYAPFVFISFLLPLSIYTFLQCFRKFNISNVLIATFLSLTIYTSGYVLLSFFVILLSLFFSFFYIHIYKKYKLVDLIKILLPFLIASIIALPLYFSILDFHQLTTPNSKNLGQAAYILGTNPNISLRLLSYVINFSQGEMSSITLGLIPISIFLIFIFSYSSKISDKYKKNMALLCFIIFFIIFLSCLGKYSPFSYFFFNIPIIGKTHLYSRFLLPITLFLFIALGILLEYILLNKNEVILKRFLFFILIVFLILTTFAYLEKYLKSLTSGFFIFELILLIVFITCLNLIKNIKVIYIISAFLIFLNSLNLFYKISFENIHLQSTQESPQLYSGKNNLIYELIHNDSERLNKLVNFLKNNSKKEIIKVVDITPAFRNFSDSYFPRNFPWLLRNKIDLSYYYGYEVHLARDHKFNQKAPWIYSNNKFLFTPNIEWLEKTGAEFIFYQKGYEEGNQKLLKLIDNNKIFNLTENIIVAPIKFANPANSIFDNGYIRILSDDQNIQISNFKTNKANLISFNSVSNLSFNIQYLFWPNKRMKAYLNDEPIKFYDMNDLSTLKVPAGENKIQISYENYILDIFLFLYFTFLGIFSFFMVGKLFNHIFIIKKNNL